MSEPLVAAEECVAIGAPQQQLEPYPGRDVRIGDLRVLRALPVKGRRLIGPWCFLDRFGPLTFGPGTPMDVAPHPHMGLQTVTGCSMARSSTTTACSRKRCSGPEA